MQRKPQLPDHIRTEVDRLLDESANLFKADRLAEALDLAHQAWDLIPEPKASWDYYPQSLAVAFVEDYTDQGRIDDAKKWIETCYDVYGDLTRSEHYTLMIEGVALYKLGLKEEAYKVFSRVFDLFGRQGFKGEHLEYLEFLLKKRAS
jgi:tetratricopeptide (TPR) repeat protein